MLTFSASLFVRDNRRYLLRKGYYVYSVRAACCHTSPTFEPLRFEQFYFSEHAVRLISWTGLVRQSNLGFLPTTG